MTDLAPSTIRGDALDTPASFGTPLRFVFPQLASGPQAPGLPGWWTPARDQALVATVDREDMWAAAVARTATKFAAHGYVVRDSNDSTRRVQASQELLKRANGGEGWVPFAEKIAQDLITTDNGIFIRVRRANEDAQTVKVRLKAVAVDALSGLQVEQQTFTDVTVSSSAPGAKITGLYHLDSLRCTRTGNLAYPVRYQPVNGPMQLLRWDQVLLYADQPSPRAEMFGVGRCAASRAYRTISKLSAMEQMVYEFLTGSGANKLVFVQGLMEATLKNLIASGVAEAEAKGTVYYLGTILGAIPGDTPISIAEVRLKELTAGFVPKDERDNGYLIYANAIGIPVQDIQPLSGQGLGTGTQTVILEEAARGIGFAAFLKWWEQTVSDRVLPKTTELEFVNEHDMRDQQARATVRNLRATERATRISSGEISPAIARQLAADDSDLPKELVTDDATPGGQLADDEKPLGTSQPTPEAQALIASEPTEAPKQQQAAKSAHATDALIGSEYAAAVAWAKAIIDG